MVSQLRAIIYPQNWGVIVDKIEYDNVVPTKLRKGDFFELQKELTPDSLKRVVRPLQGHHEVKNVKPIATKHSMST